MAPTNCHEDSSTKESALKPEKGVKTASYEDVLGISTQRNRLCAPKLLGPGKANG